MRLLISLMLLAFAFVCASAVEVERFEMGKHVWTVVHRPGGLSVNYVSRHTSAIDVSAAGFFGLKTVKGRKRIHGVGWHVVNGREVIGDVQNRWVIASYPDGKFRICPSRQDALKFGQPSFGVDAMKIPPVPTNRVARQFWATKGQYYYRVKMVGNRWDCLRMARDWGFETMVHTDGGSTLEPGAKTPSIAKVFEREVYNANVEPTANTTRNDSPNIVAGMVDDDQASKILPLVPPSSFFAFQTATPPVQPSRLGTWPTTISLFQHP